MYHYKIKKFNKIIDGDTVDLDIDLGFNLTYHIEFVSKILMLPKPELKI